MHDWIDRSSRRDFLRWSAELIVAAHLPAFGCARARTTTPDTAPTAAPAKQATLARFSHLRLQTHRLEEMREFYSRTIGFPIIADSARSITFRTGDSAIEFVEVGDNSRPFYHFAFNIPENKFALGKEWLQTRVPLLRFSNGKDEIFFDNWNAHATYFHDPAHNIVEFIARHTLPNAANGPFDLNDIQCVSEIGLVAHDQQETSEAITRAFGINPYQNSYFATGDEHGLFIIPTVDYLWIPERKQPAAIFPTQVSVRSADKTAYRFENLPYEIRTA